MPKLYFNDTHQVVESKLPPGRGSLTPELETLAQALYGETVKYTNNRNKCNTAGEKARVSTMAMCAAGDAYEAKRIGATAPTAAAQASSLLKAKTKTTTIEICSDSDNSDSESDDEIVIMVWQEPFRMDQSPDGKTSLKRPLSREKSCTQECICVEA
eukprot:gene18026-27103_t